MTPSQNKTSFYNCQYGRVELLTDNNYVDWSSSLRTFLTADGTWKIVQGTTTIPVQEQQLTAAKQKEFNESLEEFEMKQARAAAMILSAVTPVYKRFIANLTDPKQMWSTLKEKLDSMQSKVGPSAIRRRFQQEKYKEGPIAIYLSRLQEYQDRLANTSYSLTDFDLISHVTFPGNLPDKFERFLDSIDMYPGD